MGRLFITDQLGSSCVQIYVVFSLPLEETMVAGAEDETDYGLELSEDVSSLIFAGDLKLDVARSFQ